MLGRSKCTAMFSPPFLVVQIGQSATTGVHLPSPNSCRSNALSSARDGSEATFPIGFHRIDRSILWLCPIVDQWETSLPKPSRCRQDQDVHLRGFAVGFEWMRWNISSPRPIDFKRWKSFLCQWRIALERRNRSHLGYLRSPTRLNLSTIRSWVEPCALFDGAKSSSTSSTNALFEESTQPRPFPPQAKCQKARFVWTSLLNTCTFSRWLPIVSKAIQRKCSTILLPLRRTCPSCISIDALTTIAR